MFGFLLLALLAGVFALGGLRRGHDSITHQKAAQALYRQRLDELAREVEDQSARQAIGIEAGRALLAAVDDTAIRPQLQSKPKERRQVWIVAMLIPLVGCLWFFATRDTGLDQLRGAGAVLSLSPGDAAQKSELELWREQLTRRAMARPSDGKSLYLLAHAHLKLGDYQAAADSFARCAELSPQDITIKVYWLQSRFLAAKGLLDKMGRNLAHEILNASPSVSVVLEILAMDAVRQGQPAEAVRFLNKALSGARDVRNQTNFVAAINELRKQLPSDGVTVEVSAQGLVPQGATLFVLARPVGGGMPLAVVKMPAMLLPEVVHLDDLVSMNDAIKLSDTAQFEVVARISVSGSPMQQPDDWHWQSEPLALPVEVAIKAILQAPL